MTLLEASRSAGPHASVCGGAPLFDLPCQDRAGLETLSPPRRRGDHSQVDRCPGECAPCLPAQALLPAHGRDYQQAAIHRAHRNRVRRDQGGRRSACARDTGRATCGHGVVIGSRNHALVHGQGPVALPVLDPQHTDFALTGARLDYVLDRPTAAVVYSCRGRAVTLFILPRSEAGTFAVRGTRNGYHMLAWGHAGLAYFAVSDAPFHELERLEARLVSLTEEGLSPRRCRPGAG